MPSHRVSLLLNTSPSLCKTSPSGSVAALRQSPLFHCVAEIRIAPQSLCCSSGSKTELSLPYAVLDCAALHLSAAVLFNSLPFLCCAQQNSASPLLASAPPLRFKAVQNHCDPWLTSASRCHCPVRRAYQPAFSSGKKFASCIM